MFKKLSIEEFINKSKKVHGDTYDYSGVEYVSSHKKVEITCSNHGVFEQTPSKHLHRSQGCPKCGRIKLEKSRLTNAQIKKYKGLVQPEEYKLIPLTQGKFAIVDNEDFEELRGINWYFGGRYAKSNIFGYMHRYIMNAPESLEVDHRVQENTLDNRKINLRLATPAQNSANTRPKGGTSKYKGVSQYAKGSKWKCSIKKKDTLYSLWGFDNEIECAKAYDRKAIELHGEFAYLNFPELKEEYLKTLEEVKDYYNINKTILAELEAIV